MIEPVEKNWQYSSPSQITTFRRCQRKWWLEKIAKFPVPVKPAAALGRGLHGELEDYLLGKRRVGQLDGRLQPAVDFGLLPAPEAVKADMVEHRFRLPSSLTPKVIIRGVIDLLEPGRVTDHKTTSSFKHMKSETELQHDAQGIIYSYHAVTERLGLPDGSVEFRLLYYRTKGRAEVRELSALMTPEILKAGWKEIVAVGKTMHKTAKLPLLDIEPNLDACNDYGGCPFRATCASTGVGSFGPLSGLFATNKKGTPPMENMQMSFAEKLKQRKASQVGEISVPLSTPGPQDINPPDGTPEFEQVSTDAPPVVKADHPYAAIVSDVLQTPEDCRAYLVREAYSGIKKAPLVEVVQHFAKVLDTEIETKGTKRHLLCRLYEAAGVPTPEALSEPTGREKLRAAAAQERAESEPETPAQAEPPPEAVEPISVEENTEPATETTLYINCLPRGVTMTYLDQLLVLFQSEVAQAAAVPFYGLVEYNNGPKRVAALISHRLENGSLELPHALYADRRTPCTDAVLEVLIPHYTNVIERT